MGAQVAAIEAAEDALRTAMLAGDVEALGALLADDAVFTDQNGARMTKADDLAVHRSGLLSITAIETRGERVVRVTGDGAIVCVDLDLAGTYDGQPFGGAFAYTRMWRREGRGWRVAAAHCSGFAGR